MITPSELKRLGSFVTFEVKEKVAARLNPRINPGAVCIVMFFIPTGSMYAFRISMFTAKAVALEGIGTFVAFAVYAINGTRTIVE
jgi:hypothetical protein